MLTRMEIENFCLDLERDHPGVPAATILNKFYAVLQDRDEQSAMIGRMRDALELVTRTGCGCHPKCLCEEPAALSIWKEEVVATAKSALEAVFAKAQSE